MNKTLEMVRSEYPFESHYLELGSQVRMHYLDEGQGEPILMVHGNPTWSFFYRNLVREFSRTHRVIVPDHVGCGLSDKPVDYHYRLATHVANLEALVHRLDLRNVTLVVHDWGGPIGLGMAGRHPDRIARMVIMNTAAFRASNLPWMLSLVRIPWLGDLLVRGLNLFVLGTAWLALGRPGSLSAPVRRGYLAPYDSWNHRIATLRFVQDIPIDAGHPSYPDLLEVERGLSRLRDKPSLLIWGMRDFVFTPRFLERWMQWLPEARVHRLDQAGHLLLEEAPEAIAGWIRDFLP